MRERLGSRSYGGTECRSCHQPADSYPQTRQCQFCTTRISTGRVECVCMDCEHRWISGEDRFDRDAIPACDTCAAAVVITCDACNSNVNVAEARALAGMKVCLKCIDQEVRVWCPSCGEMVPYSGYLRFAFWEERAMFHAAALVTHYRHEHIRSHDRACENPRYRAAIPGYNYRESKYEINNRAKRQLIRAIEKHVKEGTYPSDVPHDAIAFIRAFENLLSTDQATINLIESTVLRLAAVGT